MSARSLQDELAKFAAARGLREPARKSEPIKKRSSAKIHRPSEDINRPKVVVERRKNLKINTSRVEFGALPPQELKRIFLSWARLGRTGRPTQPEYFYDDHAKFQTHLDRLCDQRQIPQEDDFYCRVGYFRGRNLNYDRGSQFCQSISISAAKASFALTDNALFENTLRRIREVFDRDLFNRIRARIEAQAAAREMDRQEKTIEEILGSILEEARAALEAVRHIDAHVQHPRLSEEDRQLACTWSPSLTGMRLDLRRLSTRIAEDTGLGYELGRLLSARAAENAAARFYERYGRRVTDVSITQITDPNSSAWKSHDLDVQGIPVDVKNSRRSKNSPERYTEHCVADFKRLRTGRDVAIAGTLSDYIPGSRFLDGSYFGNDIIFLGELTEKKLGALKKHYQDEHFILEFGEEQGTRQFFPPWVFDYPECAYPTRKCFAEKPLGDSALQRSIWEMAGQRPQPVFLSKGVDLSAHWSRDNMKEWQWRFYKSLLLIPADYRFSLPFIFLTVLKDFVRHVVSGGSDGNYNPDRYREFLYFNDQESCLTAPLLTFDPLKTVDELITSLTTLWQGSHKLISEFKQFKLLNYNILQGKRSADDQQWWTLIAYCGGWDEVAKCGKNPLVLGNQVHCTGCRKLICSRCGFCSDNCRQMKLERRNEYRFKKDDDRRRTEPIRPFG